MLDKTLNRSRISAVRMEHGGIFSLPLPFYARSTGINVFKKGHKIAKGGILSSFITLVWGISGTGEVELFDRKFQIKAGDVFYCLPNESYISSTLSPEWRYRWLCFDGHLAEAIMLSYRYPRVQSSAGEYPEELFAEIEHSLSANDPLQLRLACACILEVLARAGGEQHPEVHSQKLAQHAAALIAANFADPQLTIYGLCERLGVHRATLTRLFQTKLKITPGRYLLECREREALSLLRGTDLSIQEVARRCGFAEARSFTRFVKRATGEPPLTLRKNS